MNTIFVSVTFFSGKRKAPPCLTNGRYYPHILVKGDSEYLGVCFVDGTECVFDSEAYAEVLPLYDGVGYHKSKVGTEFFIMEGGNAVGEGTVDDIGGLD